MREEITDGIAYGADDGATENLRVVVAVKRVAQGEAYLFGDHVREATLQLMTHLLDRRAQPDRLDQHQSSEVRLAKTRAHKRRYAATHAIPVVCAAGGRADDGMNQGATFLRQ